MEEAKRKQEAEKKKKRVKEKIQFREVCIGENDGQGWTKD